MEAQSDDERKIISDVKQIELHLIEYNRLMKIFYGILSGQNTKAIETLQKHRFYGSFMFSRTFDDQDNIKPDMFGKFACNVIRRPYEDKLLGACWVLYILDAEFPENLDSLLRVPKNKSILEQVRSEAEQTSVQLRDTLMKIRSILDKYESIIAYCKQNK